MRIHLPASPADALVAKAHRHPLASRKLWATVAGVAAIVVPAIATGGLSLPVVLGVAGPVVAYVLGQAHVDARTVDALGRAAGRER